MNVKILKTLLIVSVLLLFNGCAEKTIYIDRPIEVKVPIECEVPEVHCDFNKTTDTEVITSLRNCIVDLQHSIEVCKKGEK